MDYILDKIVPGIIGGFVALTGAYIAHRLKRRGDQLEALRKSYSQLFTAMTVFAYRIRRAASDSREALNALKLDNALIANMRSIENDTNSAIAALNDVILLENTPPYRENMSILYWRLETISQWAETVLSDCRDYVNFMFERRQLALGQLNSLENKSENDRIMQQVNEELSAYSEKNMPRIIANIFAIRDSAEKVRKNAEDLKAIQAERFANL